MDSHDEFLTFMDLLDLDEDVVDERLQEIMCRTKFTTKQLSSAIHFLKYKFLINTKEGTECANDDEFSFLAKLIGQVSEQNIEKICEIIRLTLSLNPSSIVGKSEHLVQQILSDLNLPLKHNKGGSGDDAEEEKTVIVLLYLKVCDSILDAALKCEEKLNLFSLETPLENVLNYRNEKLTIYFLTNIVPKMFEAIRGYDILTRIWYYLCQLKENCNDTALKILCSLSEFFFPVPDETGKLRFASEITFQKKFWVILECGLLSNDPSSRKMSIYLIKRAIDCLIKVKRIFDVDSLNPSKHKNLESLKRMWDDYFVLMDSLEEKQSNIVLPSLQIFDHINYSNIGSWINCAFKIGLRHDNAQVRLKCIEHKLKNEISNKDDVIIVLEALNDANLYDQEKDCKTLKNRIAQSFQQSDNFKHIFNAIPKVKWSPVPLYYLTSLFTEISLKSQLSEFDSVYLTETIVKILEIPCNNIPIRKAVKINICFLIRDCSQLNWTNYISSYSAIDWGSYSTKSKTNNPLIIKIKNSVLDVREKAIIFNNMCKSHTNIDFILLYLETHKEDVSIFLSIVDEKMRKIQELVSRQYADKTECFEEVTFISHLFEKCFASDNQLRKDIKAALVKENKTTLHYLLGLLSSEHILTIEEMTLLFKGFESMAANVFDDDKEMILQFYKSAFLLLRNDSAEPDKKVLAISIVNVLKNNMPLLKSYKHEMLNIEQVIDIANAVNFNKNLDLDDVGRLRNIFFEKSCDMAFNLVKNETEASRDANKIISFVENMIEFGGYGCLKWILRIMNQILPTILRDESSKFDVTKFFQRMWKEIEELKSNNQYNLCVEEFINLLLQKSILERVEFDDLVMNYCLAIIEFASLKNTPVYYLVRKLHSVNQIDSKILQCVLSEILMCSPVPKKDHRIAENVAVEIFQNPLYGLDKNIEFHFMFQIQHLAVSILCSSKIMDYNTISEYIINKINSLFSKKQRYHGNSHLHRVLLVGLQHLLSLNILQCSPILDLMEWAVDLLGRIPHQPSVRICMEWAIALQIYTKKVSLDSALLKNLSDKNVPITSQFIIVYWVVKHKMMRGEWSLNEFEYVMDALLSHTMGQTFNVRLNAQYLATKLYETVTKFENAETKLIREKYKYIIEVINKTFVESSKDKNFIRLMEDFFVNEFDIVEHLTPSFVYYFLPRYFDIGTNEKVDIQFVKDVFTEAVGHMNKSVSNDDFLKEWKSIHKNDVEIFDYKSNRLTDDSVSQENQETVGTIQKKYVPWKNMNDIDVYESGKKKANTSNLILVASLIDKLPNLGGMARTSEVFGVNTYVVNSLRHLQDRQFQGLSVSAERWLNVEEVRPGPPLRAYLMQKKEQGYSIVAAEQTSTSCQLQDFVFPEKTLLLLGHEKEGIPCDLLPMMDHCVEIPQQGFVRSLNVHVTAAIFVWEYSRQNMLSSRFKSN